jgi:hypothetical protein
MITNEVGEEKPETSDVAGAATVTGGLLVLVYAIVKAETYGWSSGKTIGLFLAAVALLVAFVVIELRSRAPLIRLDIFRVRSLSASNTAMLLVASGLFAMFFFASLYVQQLRGYSPIKAGLAFLPFTFGIVIGASLAQQFIKRVGVRAVTLSGLAIATVGMLLYTQLSLTGSYFGELFPAVMVTSIGMGLTFVPVTLLAMTNIPSEDAGLASGLFNTSQQIGGALGLAILSTLAATRTSHKEAALGHDAALVSGYHLAFLIGAVAMGVAIVLLGTLIRRSDVRQIQEADEPLPVAACRPSARTPSATAASSSWPRARCSRSTASRRESPRSRSGPASASRRSSGASRRRTTCSPRSSRTACVRSRSSRAHRRASATSCSRPRPCTWPTAASATPSTARCSNGPPSCAAATRCGRS